MGRHHRCPLPTDEGTRAHSVSKRDHSVSPSTRHFAGGGCRSTFPPPSDLSQSLLWQHPLIHLDFNIPLDFVLLPLIPHCTLSCRSVYMLMRPYPGCPIATSNPRDPQLNSLTQTHLLLLFSWSTRMASPLTQQIKRELEVILFPFSSHLRSPPSYLFICTHTHKHTLLYSHLLNLFALLQRTLWPLAHPPTLSLPRLQQPYPPLLRDVPNRSLPHRP